MERMVRIRLHLCPNRHHPLNRKATRPLNLEKIGALHEARMLADVLLEMPTTDNFARYRKAVINISRIFDCSFEEATHMIRNLVDNNL